MLLYRIQDIKAPGSAAGSGEEISFTSPEHHAINIPCEQENKTMPLSSTEGCQNTNQQLAPLRVETLTPHLASKYKLGPQSPTVFP